MALFTIAPPAFAIGTNVGLGVASSYSVLGGQSVTNTGPSTLKRSVGVNPGTSVTGFPPGHTSGVIHVKDANSLQAQSDLTTAYNNAAGQAPDARLSGELGGSTLDPGVYKAGSSTQITGTLTLDAHGNPDAVFIFQVGSDLTTATSSSVVMLNAAQSCHVFWQVGSSATLGSGTTFVGTIMALTSITVDTGATVEGRALARNGSVTLDNNVFTDPKCTTTSAGSSSSTGATATATTRGTSSSALGGGHTATSTTQAGGHTATSTTQGGGQTDTSTTSGGLLPGSANERQPSTSLPASTESAAGFGARGASTGQLAETGGPSGLMLVIGIVAALAGLVLIVSTTRRRLT